MRINEAATHHVHTLNNRINEKPEIDEQKMADEQPIEVRIEDTLELSDRTKSNLQNGAEVIGNIVLENSFDFTKRDMFDGSGRILDSSPRDIEVYGVLLKNKDVSILYATDSIVGSLMNTYSNWQNNTPAEREASKLLAMRQAEYIAQNYLTEDEANDYLKVVKEQIESIGKSPEGYKQIGYTSSGKGGAAIYVQNGQKDTDISDTDRLRMTDKYEEIRAYRDKYGVNQEYMRMMSDAIKRYEGQFSQIMKQNEKEISEQAQTYTPLSNLNINSLESFINDFIKLNDENPLLRSMIESMASFTKILAPR